MAGRILALAERSEPGGDGVIVCLAENGLWGDALTDLGWLLLEIKDEKSIKQAPILTNET